MTHQLLVIGQDVIRFQMCNDSPTGGHTTIGDEIGFQKNVQCCSHSVGQRTRLAFRKMCNVTAYFLLLIRQGVMKLAVRKMCNVTHFLLVIGQGVMRLPFRQMCNVTHFLLVMW